MAATGLAPPFPHPTSSRAWDRRLCFSARALNVALRFSCGAHQGAIALESPGRNRRCEFFDLHRELVPYESAWSWQKSMVAKRHALMDKGEDHCDALIALQHPPVYTLGTGSLEEYLKFDAEDAPFEVFRTERGGEVTFHGPGQMGSQMRLRIPHFEAEKQFKLRASFSYHQSPKLVMYPILNLRRHKMDLHWYLRSLEEVIIRALSAAFSVEACRLDGLTGVWVGDQKIAAIGIRVSRWLTYHGLALNVSTDLAPFADIVPCGIRDRDVGSLHRLLGAPPAGAEERDDVLLMDAAHAAVLREFCEVFQLSLEPASAADAGLLKRRN